MASIKYISYDNLTLYDTLLDGKIDAAIAKTLKAASVSSDGKKLLLYREEAPTSETIPAFEIEFPETDLSGVMKKVASAVNGNVGTFQNGSIADSGVSINDLATKTYVSEEVAKKIAESTHASMQIVTQVPTAEEAKSNIIYLYKVTTATGDDVYEMYMLIGGEVVLIDDTTLDLTNYLTKQETLDQIAAAKQAAINSAVATAANDATSKANKALADAKAYTDTKISDVTTKINKNTESINNINTNITNINTTLQTHEDRIESLESGMPEIATASEEDIRALF